MRRSALACLVLLIVAGCRKAPPAGPPPHQIHATGSAATFPFLAAAAERFTLANATSIAPLVRAEGTGAGIAAFCAGLGALHPDLVGTTRPMTAAEARDCAGHGVDRVATIPIGYGALVLIEARGQLRLSLTRADLYRAITGHAARWPDVDPGLPDRAIVVAGPTPDPKIADGLFGLLLAPGCSAARGTPCGPTPVRADGVYRGYGAAADLVVQAVTDRPGTIGIVPWATAWAHADAIELIPLDGVQPGASSIASGRYPARQPLFLMMKPGEAPAVPGLSALLRQIAAALGPGGAFASAGLVPLPPAELARSRAALAATASR